MSTDKCFAVITEKREHGRLEKWRRIPMAREPIRSFSGKIISCVENKPNGDIVVTDFYGKVLGKYDKQFDVTRDFYGKIIARGNCVGMLYHDSDLDRR